MKIPNGHAAMIDPRKLADYALSMEHEDGRHKAALFRDLLGITADNADLLLDALEHAAAGGEAVIGKIDRYGQRFATDFPLTGPAGTAMVRAAWIIRTGETNPRLVTCYII